MVLCPHPAKARLAEGVADRDAAPSEDGKAANTRLSTTRRRVFTALAPARGRPACGDLGLWGGARGDPERAPPGRGWRGSREGEGDVDSSRESGDEAATKGALRGVAVPPMRPAGGKAEGTLDGGNSAARGAARGLLANPATRHILAVWAITLSKSSRNQNQSSRI